MILKEIIKLTCSGRFVAVSFLFALVNLRWHCCQGFENVEKFVVPVPIDLSILRPRGSQSLPVVVDVDLSILSPKEPFHPINNNHRQRIQPPWGIPHHGQSRFNINNNKPDAWYSPNNGLRTNQLDLMPFNYPHGRLPYLQPNLNRQKASPPIEDAYTDYLREQQYGSDEEQDYDMEDADLIEDYPELYEDTDNHIIPEVNKKSSQELVARPNKKSKSWMPNAKGDFWRLAHKLRRDKGRRKTKRSVPETGHHILAKYLSSRENTKPSVQKS